LAVEDVSFLSRYVLDITCIDQTDFYSSVLQDVIERNPIDPGRLHGNRSNGRLEKPLSQFMEIASKAGKDFDRFSISIRRDCNIDFGRTDIDTGSIGIDGFEGLWSDGFVAVFLLGLWFVIRFLLLEVKEIVLRTQTRLLL
jgi:hypothetical protein